MTLFGRSVLGASLLILCFFAGREFVTKRTMAPSETHIMHRGVGAPLENGTRVKPAPLLPTKDWRAALRVMGAAATSSRSEKLEDAVTFPSFVDASRFAPEATFGTFMATCSKAFADADEDPPDDGTPVDFDNMTAQAPQSYKKLLGSLNAPALVMEDMEKRFGGGGDNSTAVRDTGGGENLVWILAGHIQGEAVRFAEEAMRSRVRLYPKSRIILVDNDSPSREAAKLHALVETVPGNHSYVHNPPPSLYEPGAYFSGIKQLLSTVLHPPENEIVVFTQATTILLRPLPLDGIFEPGCDIRPMYPQCCGKLETPPCNESEQIGWASEVAPFDYPPKCKELCPNGACLLNYTNRFGAYKDRICGQEPVLGLMHASMIATGFFARNVLFGGLGFPLACKTSETLSGYWVLAGRTKPGASCTAPVDVDTNGMSEQNYFTYKFHGSAEGWGQRLQARFLKWLQTLDMDSDGEVTLGEMVVDQSRWKKASQEFCKSAFKGEGREDNIKRYIQLTARWYMWCGAVRNESYYDPTMCDAAHGIRTRKSNSTTLVESYYKHWLQKLNE